MHICRLETTRKEIIDGCKLPENNCSPNLINFMEKVMEISGIGDRTYFHDGEHLALHPPIKTLDWRTGILCPEQLHSKSHGDQQTQRQILIS